MESAANSLLDRPAYGNAEAAQYLRLDRKKLVRWIGAGGLVDVTSEGGLSFNNLAELDVLQFLRKERISLQKMRRALDELRKRSKTEHPLLEESFQTDRVDFFVEDPVGPVNLSQHGQRAIKEVVSLVSAPIGTQC